MATEMLKIVRGNRARLTIPLQLLTWENGKETVSDYTPTAEAAVRARNYANNIALEIVGREGNTLTVEVTPAMPNGEYAVEITDGDRRAMRRGQFRVVETTDEAGIAETVEFEYLTAQLAAQVFFAGASSGGGALHYVEAVWNGEGDTAETSSYTYATDIADAATAAAVMEDSGAVELRIKDTEGRLYALALSDTKALTADGLLQLTYLGYVAENAFSDGASVITVDPETGTVRWERKATQSELDTLKATVAEQAATIGSMQEELDAPIEATVETGEI